MNSSEDKTTIQRLEDCRHRLRALMKAHEEFIDLLRDTQDEIDELARRFGVPEPSQERSGGADQSTPLMREHEVVRYLGISRATLHRRVKAGDIKKIKVGGSVRFAREELDRYLAGTQS